MIIELVSRGEAPDVVMLADTGSERPVTEAFIPLFRAWMDDHGVANHVVRYEPSRFKHWPPYRSLLENLLTKGTLPSISFNRHSCSQKWKIAPQDRWAATWPPALAAWAQGDRVVKLIGHDCSPAAIGVMRIARGLTIPILPSDTRFGSGDGPALIVRLAFGARGFPCRSNPPAFSVQR